MNYKPYTNFFIAIVVNFPAERLSVTTTLAEITIYFV